MTHSAIPSKLDFWLKHVEALETCSICLEPFSSIHTALRFTGPNACSHVFGHPCLREWTETANQNANRCPVCRRVLWKSEDPYHVTNVADITDEDLGAAEEALENLQEALENFEHNQDAEALQNLQDLLMARLEATNARLPVGNGVEHGSALPGRPANRDIDDSEDEWGLLPRPANRGIDEHEYASLSDSSSISTIDEHAGADAERADEHLSDETMSRLLTSVLDTEDSDDDDDGVLDTPTASPIRTISLKTLDRNIFNCLLDDLYNLSAPDYLMPTDASMSHTRERMEQCVDVALLEAGFTEPGRIAPGLLDNMLMHFQSMVVHRRTYTVSDAYLEWWKDAMLAHIEREESDPLEPRAPIRVDAGRQVTGGFGGSFRGFSAVPNSTALSGTSHFGRASGLGIT